MNSVKNILQSIERYNSLIKYRIKSLSGERKTGLFENIVSPDPERLKADVLLNLEKKTFPNDFVDSVNRIYLLGEANSDLSVEFPEMRKTFGKEYSAMSECSFEAYQFLREHVFHAKDEFGCPMSFEAFDHDALGRYPEYLFKDNPYLLFPALRLLTSVTNAYFGQLKSDFENLLSFKTGKETDHFRQSQKEKLAENIISLSADFCDRDIPFLFIKDHPVYDQLYLFAFLLADVLEKISAEEFGRYVTFDYEKFPWNFRWEFNRLPLRDYSGLAELQGFERLVNILASALLLKELDQADHLSHESEPKADEVEGQAGRTSDPESEKPNREKSPKQEEYITPVPILNIIYEEFNGELWDEISLTEFMSMFTNGISKQPKFRIKHMQTSRFYYLLKRIWLNGDQSLFPSEKDWVVPFLENYNLSFSAYANQSVKNGGQSKHKQFIRSTDRILPKKDDF